MLLKAVKRHMNEKLMMMTFFHILIRSLRISLSDMHAIGRIPSPLLLQSATDDFLESERPLCCFPVQRQIGKKKNKHR